MTRFLWICAGGAAGTGARYLLSGWALARWGSGYPWGTLAVNVVGSFLLGLVVQAAPLLSPTLRLSLTTGLMGGFTTYSAFNQETIHYMQNGSWPVAMANVSGTLIGCLLAGCAGILVGRWIFGG